MSQSVHMLSFELHCDELLSLFQILGLPGTSINPYKLTRTYPSKDGLIYWPKRKRTCATTLFLVENHCSSSVSKLIGLALKIHK